MDQPSSQNQIKDTQAQKVQKKINYLARLYHRKHNLSAFNLIVIVGITLLTSFYAGAQTMGVFQTASNAVFRTQKGPQMKVLDTEMCYTLDACVSGNQANCTGTTVALGSCSTHYKTEQACETANQARCANNNQCPSTCRSGDKIQCDRTYKVGETQVYCSDVCSGECAAGGKPIYNCAQFNGCGSQPTCEEVKSDKPCSDAGLYSSFSSCVSNNSKLDPGGALICSENPDPDTGSVCGNTPQDQPNCKEWECNLTTKQWNCTVSDSTVVNCQSGCNKTVGDGKFCIGGCTDCSWCTNPDDKNKDGEVNCKAGCTKGFGDGAYCIGGCSDCSWCPLPTATPKPAQNPKTQRDCQDLSDCQSYYFCKSNGFCTKPEEPKSKAECEALGSTCNKWAACALKGWCNGIGAPSPTTKPEATAVPGPVGPHVQNPVNCSTGKSCTEDYPESCTAADGSAGTKWCHKKGTCTTNGGGEACSFGAGSYCESCVSNGGGNTGGGNTGGGNTGGGNNNQCNSSHEPGSCSGAGDCCSGMGCNGTCCGHCSK